MQIEVGNKPRESTGAVDGPEKLLRCYLCDRALLNLKVVRPDINRSFNVVVFCPCGDSSLPYCVQGKFYHEIMDGLEIKSISPHGNKIEYCLGNIRRAD